MCPYVNAIARAFFGYLGPFFYPCVFREANGVESESLLVFSATECLIGVSLEAVGREPVS